MEVGPRRAEGGCASVQRSIMRSARAVIPLLPTFDKLAPRLRCTLEVCPVHAVQAQFLPLSASCVSTMRILARKRASRRSSLSLGER